VSENKRPIIKGFVFCEDCNAYESVNDCVASSSGYCTCCDCNPVLNGTSNDHTGRRLRR
tara:strand:- start:1648 stop:1824 length:177 start_codon:yes stop_codon:yes gene_type:complete